MIEQSGFVKALLSSGPASDRTEQLKLYSWLIGDWTMDATVHGVTAQP